MSKHTGETSFREEIRPADVEGVRALVSATGFFSADEVVIAAELVQERLEKGAASGYEFVPADRDGQLEGYSCYGLIPCSTVSWDLYWIAVKPSGQGSGLGRLILALTEKWIAEAGGLACYARPVGAPSTNRPGPSICGPVTLPRPYSRISIVPVTRNTSSSNGSAPSRDLPQQSEVGPGQNRCGG